MNETFVWVILFSIAALMFFWAKRQQSNVIKTLVCLFLLPIVLISHLSIYRINDYLAVNSSIQQHKCGIFSQENFIEHHAKSGSYKQSLYEFKTETGEIFAFAYNRHLARRLPQIRSLQPQQKICFQYSPKFKDSDGYYVLTDLKLQNQ
ncbi:hypothetical protein QTA56_10155 [Acinetobacter sp. VNH17]|uniref:DUF3592 domain-containing protein n=1 Tax=Acinetobacter thutiue TaxID=2998078 RepID=A0ABT7WPI1_9GAMM|nr:hypothetical protein [Acinetobacter thutiue]MCY6412486.1 hypothetical protein [Acinetobacter thutiue]MDM1018896.1 hypothetical protein [Acinetobacter thutiue]MDN0014593.1 hypothetical protein [Acinetobacter thutiue]